MSTINVADKAVAQAALTEVLSDLLDSKEHPELEDPIGLADETVSYLLGKASRVRFQPSTRQLVLTFDLAFNTSEPDTSGPVQ